MEGLNEGENYDGLYMEIYDLFNHRFRHPSLTLLAITIVLANVLTLPMLWIYAALDVGLQPMLDMGVSG
ncbi:MAG TPA: hypothetical protein DCW86_00625, partial [Actinobacteria bacterium]|nr:hypothetical protein [Actinomycetota bacterium]